MRNQEKDGVTMKEVKVNDFILKADEPKRYWLSVHTDENEKKQVYPR